MNDLERFAADFHEHGTRDANWCLVLGVEQRRDELPDPSLEFQAETVAAARALLERADALGAADLAFHDALDLDLARLCLQWQVHEATVRFNDSTCHPQQPRAGEGVGEGLFLLFANDPRPAAERLGDITARVEAVPGYLDAMLGRLEQPVARWVKMDLESVQALPEFLDTLQGWAQAEGWPGNRRLRETTAAARAALSRYAERLASLPTTPHFHLGPEATRRVVELRGIDRSPEQLHTMARDFLRDNAAAVEALRTRLVHKLGLDPSTSAEQLQQHLNQHHAVQLPDGDLDAVLARYEAERDRLAAWNAERRLFPVPADQEITILRTPGFLEPGIPAGAMMCPPPFRAGVARSLVYLTLKPELMDEHTELSIPGMMLHEGLPGHHLQMAWAARHPSVIRRHVDAMDLCEGWTTYLEDYVLDQGYLGELADEARFITKRDIARIGARVAIDLFFMSGERGYLDVGVACDLSSPDPFEAAGSLLRAVTGFTPARAQAELNWYSKERGYPLSYLTGNRLVLQLKRDVERAAAARGQPAGEDLDRRFHEAFLHAGNMPVRHLRRVFEHEGLLEASVEAPAG